MQHSIRTRAASWLAVFLLALGVVFTPEARAQFFHGASIQKNPVGPTGLPKAHVGDTITAAIRVRNVDDFEDTLVITSIVDIVYHTSLTTTSANLLATNVPLPTFGDSVTVTNTYPVLPGDPDVLQDDAEAGGIDNHDGTQPGIPQDFLVRFPGQVRILKPCIRVTKSCLNGIGENGQITWSGTITNCGNTLLTNVTVSNLVNGVMTLVFGPTTLNTNGSATFGGSYQGSCTPTTDTLLAQGTDELNLTVNHSATATCSNIITSGISITKNCPEGRTPPGSLLTFSGIVSNTGNVTLTNVVIVDNQPAPGTPVAGPFTLAPGAIFQYSGSYTTPADNCGPWSDTVSVTARSICGQPVSASASATCPAVTTPGIAVAKLCPANPVAPGGVLNFTGFVTNTGNVTLTNVVVVNNQPQAGTVVFGPTNLAPGAVLGFSGSYTVPANACGPWVDTLTATARTICGDGVTNTTTATCAAQIISGIAVTRNCPPTPTPSGSPLVYTGSVSNTGNVTITNVVVTSQQPTPGTVAFTAASLAPGQVLFFTNSYVVPAGACGSSTDTLTANGRTICGTAVSNSVTGSCPVFTFATLGDFVFHDRNGNGIQDGGSETGIPGVTVLLLSNNVVQASQITAPDGSYLFPGLIPGTYSVIFTNLPAGYVFTAADQGANDALDSDANPATGRTPSVVLGCGEVNRTVDAGAYQPACLGDFVWEDVNRDGIQNDGATGISGVTVQLFACGSSNLIASTVTTGNGFYLFCNLVPGSYQTRVILPGGYNVTLRDATNDCADSDADLSGLSSCTTLSSGETNLCNDTGLFRSAALGDFVWHDRNANGIQEGGEPGIPGVTALLVSNNVVIASQLTDVNGGYLFTGLAPGSYSVIFTNIPAGFVFSPADQGANDALDSDANVVTGRTPTVTLVSGEVNRTLDAGLHQPACLGDYVWDDLNRDGIQNDGNTGISGVTVQLFACGSSNIIATTITSSNGFYLFCNLTPGSYQTRVILPGGYLVTLRDTTNDCVDSDADAAGLTPCVTLTSGETNLCNDIGLFKPAALGDFVWHDRNANGIQDGGAETGISNVTVILLSNNVAIASQLTDVNGGYLFTGLIPGSYSVIFTNLPAGYVFSPQDQGANDAIDSDANPATGRSQTVTLISGQTNRTVDAGLHQPACLGDYVWDDLNRDGLQNDGNTGISNVVVELTSCESTNVLRTTTTDANGFYLFCNLTPGGYRTHVLLPNGYRFTLRDAAGTNDCVDSDADVVTGITSCTTLSSGETNLCNDIGLFRPAAIGDFVWNDQNGNGLQDVGEPGVSNAVVQLMDCGGALLATVSTDVGGRYLFSGLVPGSYKVTFVTPPGGTPTLANQSPDDRDSDADTVTGMTACYTLISGQTNLTVDAGYVFCTNTTATTPANQVVCLTQTATFSTIASGTGPFRYQWLKNGTPIANATNSTYSFTVTSTNDAGTYCVSVRGECGGVTNCATLEVLVPSIIVTKSCPQAPVPPGGVLTFTGSVSNNGTVTITNVFVVNNQPQAGTVVFGPTNLAPGQIAFFSGSYTVPIGVCGPWSDTLTASGTTTCGIGVTNSNTQVCPSAPVSGIAVTKQCAGPIGPGETLIFSGSVSNTGNVNLTNVVVVNDQPSPGTVVFGPVSLAPGQILFFTNNYRIPLDFCGPAVDTLTATARSVCGDAVTNTATASCPVITKAILQVAKNCPPAPVAPGGLLVFTGSVSNAGNITITNVIVSNDQPQPGTVVFGPATLAPGEVAVFTNSYRVPLDQCGPWFDRLTATGTSKCGVTVEPATATATCPAIITPQIRVAKFCPEGPVPPGGTLVFSGVVSNTGNITLTNVVVVNSQPQAGTPVFGPVTLAPGQSQTFTGSYVVPTNQCGPWVDTLTATGNSKCGEVVSHSATASCEAVVQGCVVVQKFCPPPTPPGELIVYTGSVSNCGNIGLTNIVVTNDRQPGVTVFGPTNLAPGQVYFFTNSYRAPLDSCGPVFDNLFVSGNTLCGQPVTNFVDSACPLVTAPSIRVAKFCPDAPVAPGGVLVFTGAVTNTGNITLTNIVVVNDQPAPGTVVLGPLTLAPGQFRLFTNSYTTPRNQCGPWVDRLTATARSICGVNVTNNATAICPAITSPAIRVTKSCPATPTGPGELLVFSGSVSNAGDVTLINVTVVNSQPQAGTAVIGPITLQPGEVRTFTASYRTPPDTCGPYSDTLTARGTSICGQAVTNTASATCPGITTPRISVTKSCPATNTPFNSLMVVSGLVSNSGNVTLTNVIVFDNKPTNGTPLLGPITLAPGQFARYTNSYRIEGDCCGPYADMVTARGTDKCTGSNVMKTATAVCPSLTLPALSITRTCPTNPIVLGLPITFSGIVSNSGTVVLSNVVVIGHDGQVIMSMQGFSVGEWMDYTGSFTVTTCPPSGQVTNIVTISGYDICSGQRVTQSATCIVSCEGSGKPPVVIFSPVITRKGFAVSFQSEQGLYYTIQCTSSLTPPVEWQTIHGTSGTGGVITYEDPIESPNRFYRVICDQEAPKP